MVAELFRSNAQGNDAIALLLLEQSLSPATFPDPSGEARLVFAFVGSLAYLTCTVLNVRTRKSGP